MSEQGLEFTVHNGIAELILNRPERGNGLDLDMAKGLLQLAIRCDQDKAIRCVVLSGGGRMFCVGGDIGGFAAAGAQAGSYLSELAGTMNLALSRLLRMNKPLLTLVNGPAAGAGLSLALSGDVVLASPAASFTSAYTAIGMAPDCGLSWILPRVAGLRVAQEMILTNRTVKAEEAASLGLVTRLVDDLERAGQDMALSLARGACGAIGASRRLLLDTFSSTLETALEREAREIAAAGASPEGQEGVAAFLGKRKPAFGD